MKAAVTGATGFIGRALCKELVKHSKVVALTRSKRKAKAIFGDSVEIVEWNGRDGGEWEGCIDGCDAIVNLAGANVASGRWSQKRKEDILQSRLNTVSALKDAIDKVNKKPKVFVQASAIGFYKSQSEEMLDENSEGGEGFLAKVCQDVEKASGEIESSGIRLVIIRTGVVLGSGGGALPQMIQPFKFYAGGYLGSGTQWMSWISLEDEIAAIQYLLEHNQLNGVFNLTSPKPVKNRVFFKTLGSILGRPCWLPVPEIVLKIFFGEMADELFFSSQRVYPKRLIDEGFEFKYPDLKNALNTIVKKGVDDEFS